VATFASHPVDATPCFMMTSFSPNDDEGHDLGIIPHSTLNQKKAHYET
jgi:hypothetical protein